MRRNQWQRAQARACEKNIKLEIRQNWRTPFFSSTPRIYKNSFKNTYINVQGRYINLCTYVAL